MCRRPKQLVLTGWKGSVRSLVQSVHQLPFNWQMLWQRSAPPQPTIHKTSLANKGILHMFDAFTGLTIERNFQLISIPVAECFRKLSWELHSFKITGSITQLYLVFPHTPPFLIFLCLHLSSSTLSLCHLLSRRSSLSHIQVCTVKCFQIGKSWGKGRNLLVSASLAQGLRCS